MSRVTKLQKHYRRLQRDKGNARRRYWAQNRRLRVAQGGGVDEWRPRSRDRRAARQRARQRCSCGHVRHGKYGCLHGCPWGACDVIRFNSIVPSPIDQEFQALSEQRLNAVLGAFMLPTPGLVGLQVAHTLHTLHNVLRVLVVGDMALDKARRL